MNTETLRAETLIVLKKLREQNVEIINGLAEIKKRLEPSGESESVVEVLEELLAPITRDIAKIGDNIEMNVESKKLLENEKKFNNNELDSYFEENQKILEEEIKNLEEEEKGDGKSNVTNPNGEYDGF